MANGFNTSPFVLPQMFNKPGESLQQGLAMQERRKERQSEIDYRNQRNQEADDWRKLQMIQEFTNLDKYQTGDSVADALGGQKMAEVVQRYSMLAKNMPMPELMYKLSQETSNTHNAMMAMKDEFIQFGKKLPELQKQFPSLNTRALEQKYREDVIGRRIKQNEFSNPTHVPPSTLDVYNPEVLADFIGEDSDKIIRKEILNPEIYQIENKARGNRDSYSKFKEKLSPFAISNLKPEDFNADQFLKEGIEPKIRFDSNQEDLFGEKVETLSPQAYKTGFTPEANLAFISMAKRGMPQWSKMTPDEKDKSIRAIALDYVKKLDKSGYSFENANPPAARNTTNNYSGESSGINNVYKRIDEKINANFARGFNATRFNSLDNDEQQVIKTAVENAGHGVAPGGSNIYLTKDSHGNIKIYKKGDDGSMKQTPENEIASLSFQGTNLTKQADVKGKRTVVKMGEQKTPRPATAETYTRAELKGAGWSDAQINEAVKKGLIKIK